MIHSIGDAAGLLCSAVLLLALFFPLIKRALEIVLCLIERETLIEIVAAAGAAAGLSIVFGLIMARTHVAIALFDLAERGFR